MEKVVFASIFITACGESWGNTIKTKNIILRGVGFANVIQGAIDRASADANTVNRILHCADLFLHGIHKLPEFIELGPGGREHFPHVIALLLKV